MATVSVKERPILFSGEMVKAILDGRKTQTRRVMKQQPEGKVSSVAVGMTDDGSGDCYGIGSKAVYGALFRYEPGGDWLAKCPYGRPGDRLTVKEGLRGVVDVRIDPDEKMPIAAYSADGSHIWTKNKFRVPWRWKKSTLPSMFMPLSLSRITLEITEVRVQRLQDISKPDCIAEGMAGLQDVHAGWHQSYAELWNRINGAGSWEADPWVWAITFRKV